MKLVLHVPGAPADSLAEGLTAAQAVFDQAGVTALQAAQAAFKREGWDMRGFKEADAPTDAEMDAAAAWDDAEPAAFMACCGAGLAVPPGAFLALDSHQ